MRKPIIAGNWKMNKTVCEAESFAKEVACKLPGKDLVESVICPAFTALRTMIAMQGENLRIGAQNMYYLDHGAYTGEVSGEMLKEIGTTYVIVGHSERRKYFNETDETCNLKLKKAFRLSLKPIFCIGEGEEVRVGGKTKELLRRQLQEGLKEISKEDVKNLVIAYEPIWAIGTGRTASPEVAEDACCFIRLVIGELYDKDTADAVRIQYGGSVNVKNIKELLAEPDIDGALIGGASLNADDFLFMVSAAI